MPEKPYKAYRYEGPVFNFDKIFTPYWSGFTQAATERKALSNLIFQCKGKFKMDARSGIKLLPQYLKEI